MTKQEFQEMTGLAVNEEQMWGIHEAYITSGLDKQDFCEAIKSQKGAAELAQAKLEDKDKVFSVRKYFGI